MFEALDRQHGYEPATPNGERKDEMVLHPDQHHVGVGELTTTEHAENMIANPATEPVRQPAEASSQSGERAPAEPSASANDSLDYSDGYYQYGSSE